MPSAAFWIPPPGKVIGVVESTNISRSASLTEGSRETLGLDCRVGGEPQFAKTPATESAPAPTKNLRVTIKILSFPLIKSSIVPHLSLTCMVVCCKMLIYGI